MSRLYRIGDYDSAAAKIQADEWLDVFCSACGHMRNISAHVIEDPCSGVGKTGEDCGCIVDSYVLEAITTLLESRMPSFLAPKANCGCMGHSFRGVRHMVACCDVPHIDQ